jgi:ABC-type sulfate/molybdate transport systems ATPase subunit
MKESKQARWRGLNMGVVFQFFQLLPMLSLVENVLLPMDFCEKYDPEVRYDRAMELLTLVGLQDVAHKLPGSVSGGQQQSAAIARALANDPPIIVADEPTGNLDARTAETVYDKFESLANEGRTIIMITHDQEIEPRLSRKILISDGEVIDPTLIHTFPWLPHSSLKVLNHALRRMTYQQGENLDITGDLADQLMMIEEGKILLSYRGRFRKSKTANLTEGNYFVGPNIIEDEHLRQYQAKVLTETTTVAILSWDVLAPEVQIVTKGPHKLQEHLRRQMLGEAIENHERKEMIQ